MARILNTPALALAIPKLQPEVLHGLIRSCGLEDCGELVALATPAQLSATFDLDLWKGRPGAEEAFDPDRFGVWLEVLLESGASFAARTLASMEPELVTAGFAQHIRVFDLATVRMPSSAEDDDIVETNLDDDLGCEIGGYLVVARRSEAWDAIVAILIGLDAEHGDCFHRVMHGCRRLSNSGREVDGLDQLLDDGEQVMFDRAFAREGRRERKGYLPPQQAAAFLRMSRTLSLGRDSAPPEKNAVAAAYLQAIKGEPDLNNTPADAPSDASSPPTQDSSSAVAAVVDVMVDGGVLPRPPRALIGSVDDPAPRLGLIQSHLAVTCERDQTAFVLRNQELGFLANALVAGCPIQERPFTTQEASQAALAICNLGLENWPAHWPPQQPADLVNVFQVGWTTLHQEACMFAASGLVATLRELQSHDVDIMSGLDDLRSELVRHTQTGQPWLARESFDVLAILDMPAWAALLGVIDECPTIHGALAASRSGVKSVSGTAFAFISENSQIAAVHEFMASLANRLRE